MSDFRTCCVNLRTMFCIRVMNNYWRYILRYISLSWQHFLYNRGILITFKFDVKEKMKPLRPLGYTRTSRRKIHVQFSSIQNPEWTCISNVVLELAAPLRVSLWKSHTFHVAKMGRLFLTKKSHSHCFQGVTKILKNILKKSKKIYTGELRYPGPLYTRLLGYDAQYAWSQSHAY